MGLRDQITTALGGALGSGLGLLTESLSKANGQNADEPALRGGASRAMVGTDGGAASLPPAESGQDPRGLLWDPFALIDQLGYRDRPSGITYATLRQLATRVPTYSAFLQTRLTQISGFTQLQADQHDTGFGVVLRDREKSPTPIERKRCRELEDWIVQTGSKWTPGRDNFRTFVRKIARDALVLDQCCFEVVRNRKGEPAEFYAMDGGTIRIADVPPGADIQGDPEQVKYVQVYDEIVITEYAGHELCFGVRNPRTDIRANGYGLSELELLVNVVTSTLWSLEYNKRQFSQGFMGAGGILNFKGAVADAKVDAFRRQWKMMVSGVNNAHRVPMTNVDELQWIDMGKNNRDMEFSQWLDFLIKITCAVCQFDPAEMNFSYGNSGQTSQMGGTNNPQQKIQASQDRGLKPLLKDLAQWINQYLIWPLAPDFELEFMGLDAESAQETAQLGKMESEFKKTVDEIRAEDDLPPLPNGEGEVILNPTWLQAKQAAAQAAMGQQPMEGQPDEGYANEVPGEESAVGLQEQEQPAEEQPGANPEDFNQLYPAQKAAPRTTDLRKGGKKAKVRVFEIDI
jgi:hypothetical protein